MNGPGARAGSVERRALAAASALAAEHGLRADRALVLHSGSNVLVELAPSPVVARVMTGTAVLHEQPERWLAREVAVLDFLAPSGLAVVPSPAIAPGPHRSDGLWMTCWALQEHRGRARLRDAARLGRALRALHDGLAGFAGELPGFAELCEDIERLRSTLRPTAELSSARIEALGASMNRLEDTVFGRPWPAQPLHGDASLYNLLEEDSGRLVWNDFEDTRRGPVHWDLAGYVISLEACGADAGFVDLMLDAYGGPDREELDPFLAAHAVYDEIWRLYDAQRRA